HTRHAISYRHGSDLDRPENLVRPATLLLRRYLRPDHRGWHWTGIAGQTHLPRPLDLPRRLPRCRRIPARRLRPRNPRGTRPAPPPRPPSSPRQGTGSRATTPPTDQPDLRLRRTRP